MAALLTSTGPLFRQTITGPELRIIHVGMDNNRESTASRHKFYLAWEVLWPSQDNTHWLWPGSCCWIISTTLRSRIWALDMLSYVQLPILHLPQPGDILEGITSKSHQDRDHIRSRILYRESSASLKESKFISNTTGVFTIKFSRDRIIKIVEASFYRKWNIKIYLALCLGPPPLLGSMLITQNFRAWYSCQSLK